MNKIYSKQPLIPLYKREHNQVNTNKKNNDFRSLLQGELQKESKLKFSKHAQKRLESREINFSEHDMNKLEEAVDRAKDKGVKESLILLNNNAYIVSVKNQTVITAMDQEKMKENLFTNIDSAIIIK